MTRLFGVTVVGGLSSENRVFARLLAERDDRYESLVAVHEESGSQENSAALFGELAACPTVAIDTGWRPNPRDYRYDPARARVVLRFRQRLERVLHVAEPFAPDVVYSSQQHYDCRAASKVARARDVPQIVHLHYNVGPWLRRFVLKQLRTTDRVVAVSDFIRAQTISHGMPEDRVSTIHNTVPPYGRPAPSATQARRDELELGEDRFLFGLVGRLDPGKGHLDAIAAFERIAPERADAALVFVGAGRIEAKIRARARRSPVADRILFTGQRADVAELLSVFDALVHPASQDPCPLAVLEAMAAALPVVAYDDGGVPELVQSGSTGLLVEHGRVGALAEAMAALHDDPAKAQELGAAGARRATTSFSPPQAGRLFADLVSSMS
jgi:glycosyltransferase involved in cell wall biosynthesis